MRIDIEDYRVRPDGKVALHRRPTRAAPCYRSKQHYQQLLQRHVAVMAELQERLYATDQHALLLIFQAMDAAGKDGVIKHVMSGVNPQGCQVFSFKHPSAEDLDHDFLWRTVQCLPERGRIGIFNRSYYEEVLVVRVHPEILRGERIPADGVDAADIWQQRFKSIRQHESHLHRNGTRIVKFFLHLSRGEQRQRLLARLDDPAKHWKFSSGDLAERERWDDYLSAYEECLAATSTKQAPWYVVPADDKPNARLIVSEIVVATLKALKLQLPPEDAARKRELSLARRRLLAESAPRARRTARR
jgi:PPK2 family polyphosphate:nucleotide phosphotransferase